MFTSISCSVARFIHTLQVVQLSRKIIVHKTFVHMQNMEDLFFSLCVKWSMYMLIIHNIKIMQMRRVNEHVKK